MSGGDAGSGGGRLILRLVRHGETEWNAAGRIQGWIDIPLNDTGRAQAAAVARSLAGAGVGLVVASDLLRAAETGRIIAAHLGVDLRSDPGFRERNLGELQGLTAADIGARDGGQSFVARMVDDPDSRPPGGEGLAGFRARVRARIDELLASPPASDLVLVTHGGVMRAVLRALLGSDQSDVIPRLANCSVIALEACPGGVRVLSTDTPATDAAHAADEAAAR